jgi:predicted transcriptional regulator
MADNLPAPAPQNPGEFILFQSEDGSTRIEVRFEGETVWLSLNQMAELFQRDKSVISRHIANLFEEGELRREAVVAVYATTAADQKTYQVEYFNLDVIISVGYQEIVADYNRGKDRATVEDTFARLVDLADSLDGEQRRAAQEGLSEDEQALFDLLYKETISKADRERLKQASRQLLSSLQQLLQPMERWIEKEQTQSEVRMFILDQLCTLLPDPPYTPEDTESVANVIYDFVWQRSASGYAFQPTAAV